MFKFLMNQNMKRYSDFSPLDITDYDQFLESSKTLFYSTWLKTPSPYVEKLEDFEIIEIIGQGTFGKVVLVQNKLSERHRFHAMKIIEKKKVIEKKQVENTRSEKNLLLNLAHPLMIYMDFFFQDNSYLYFIMPHITGGELYKYFKKFGRFDEVQSQFYAAQIILAVEYLHYIEFIHRDIKPENILIDHRGYLKLADFGFCKRMVKGRTYTLCGTPEYMAPEILLHKGYGFSVDWWAVGILTFELNAGVSPFYSKNISKVFQKVTTNNYKMPIFFSSELQDLILNLLQDNTSKRYGNLKGGVNDIKMHKWFRSMNWLALLCRKVEAPYKPQVENPGTKVKSASSVPVASKLDLVVSEENKYKRIFDDF